MHTKFDIYIFIKIVIQIALPKKKYTFQLRADHCVIRQVK
jgi:hypothetical protein